MEQEDYLKSDTNRLENKVDDINSLTDVDDMMLELMGVFTEVEVIPDVGRYYTFIYSAETPRIEYDEFPLIACIGVFNWGFKGINYHWSLRQANPYRNYTWNEVKSNLHLVYPNELEDVRSIPYMNFKINN